jgi:hypothetical protein
MAYATIFTASFRNQAGRLRLMKLMSTEEVSSINQAIATSLDCNEIEQNRLTDDVAVEIPVNALTEAAITLDHNAQIGLINGPDVGSQVADHVLGAKLMLESILENSTDVHLFASVE